MPADRIRALTGRRRIEPTSPGCRRSRRLEPGRGSTYRAGKTVRIDRASSIQGYLASVWGVSSVLGPLAGGLIVRHMGWPWVFWINVPVGLAAAAGFLAFLREDVARVSRRVDVAGAALFTVAVASL